MNRRRPRAGGQEAVEEAEGLEERVLGLVDDAVSRVDGDRLVLEAAHRGERYGAGAVGVRRVDLEDEAVILGVAVRAGPVLGLLAGQPGAPRGGPARAVDRRTGDRDAFGEHLALPVQRQRRTAALARRIVGEALDRRDRELRGDAVLVVAHQVDAAVAARERRHSVVVAGDRALAGAERVALAGQDPVAETFRQVEQAVRVGDQRAIAPVAEVLCGGGAREELGEVSGEGDRDAQRAAAGQYLTSRCGATVFGHGATFLLADRTVTQPCVSRHQDHRNHARRTCHVPVPVSVRGTVPVSVRGPDSMPVAPSAPVAVALPGPV